MNGEMEEIIEESNKGINLIDVSIKDWELNICINLIAAVALIMLVFCAIKLFKYICKVCGRRSIDVSCAEIGIGNSKIKLEYNRKDQEVAYKIWVELSTRKIGLEYDVDNDIIHEVYNSWYSFFSTTRDLLKEIPASCLSHSNTLINLSCDVLNEGLRPHLTKWQARYRDWYERAEINNKESKNALSPQELQRTYPEYDELIKDLLETNKHMINYKNLMQDIVFGKK